MVYPRLIGQIEFNARDETGAIIDNPFPFPMSEDISDMLEFGAKLPYFSYHYTNKANNALDPFMQATLAMPAMLIGGDGDGLYVDVVGGAPLDSPYRYRYEVNGTRYYGELNPYPENGIIEINKQVEWSVLNYVDVNTEEVVGLGITCETEIPSGYSLGDFETTEDWQFGFFSALDIPNTVAVTAVVEVETEFIFNFNNESVTISAAGIGPNWTFSTTGNFAFKLAMGAGVQLHGGYSVSFSHPSINDGNTLTYHYIDEAAIWDYTGAGYMAVKAKEYIPETSITYINNANDFLNLKSKHGHFVQTDSFDLSGLSYMSLAERNVGRIEPFTGWYDGGGHFISGMGGDLGAAPSMFGYISGGHVHDLLLSDVNFGGRSRGALATACSASFFERIGITGKIDNSIPANNPNFNAQDPDNSAYDLINNSSGAGAMFHTGGNSVITNCYSRCNIKISHLYSGANGPLTNAVGGLFGSTLGTTFACYSASTIQGGTIPRFGLGNGYDLLFCYYDEDLSGFISAEDDGEPRSTEEMTYPYDENTTYIMWNWGNVWHIDPETNDGYPYLFPMVMPSKIDGVSGMAASLQITRPLSAIIEGQSAIFGLLDVPIDLQGSIEGVSRIILGIKIGVIFAKVNGKYRPAIVGTRKNGMYNDVTVYTKHNGTYVILSDGGDEI